MNVPTLKELSQNGLDPEILFWVGCAGSFDERAKKITKSFVKLLNKANISFGVLGIEESCTGDPAKRAGNEFLYQMQAVSNIEILNSYNFKKIVTTCPHCFNTIKNEYPKSWENILDIGNSHPPLIIRVNIKKGSISNYIKKLEKYHIEHLHLGMEAILIKKPIPIDSLPGFKEGEVSIQDYGAQLATHLLDLKKNYNVLDACAAPGGKACHMNEIEEIKLTAVEADKQRVERINENLKRLGQTFKVINSEIKAGNAWWDKNLFDRILLDAPCSASGIVRRHIDIKWLRRPGDLDYFHEKQFQLLRASWEMLKPLGKLLYVTCSIFEKENRSVVNRFLKEEKTAMEIKIKFPKNINVDDNQLLPSLIHDGLFYVLLEKK